MKEIKPYNDLPTALHSLDNGGRFFNFFTREDDGHITAAEIEKVAGLYGGKQKAILYLDLATARLSPADQQKIISSLDNDAKHAYEKYKSFSISAAEAKLVSEKNQNVILTGVAKHTDSKSGLNGFIIVPLMTGTVMTMIPVPIMDQYDIYEFRTEGSDEYFLVAHDKGTGKLPSGQLRVAGIIKEFHLGDDQKELRPYLEIAFYHPVS
ncbi:hypothetical protein [Pollutibacter soli]|uniref:hypothetical protein n=1 Tax=Pollutibacter soli TaxID=3034157 RepID=UPI003013D19C